MRLPKEYRFQGDRVYVKRLGDAVILLPYRDPWSTLMASLDLFSDDFMDEREQPAQQEREGLFA